MSTTWIVILIVLGVALFGLVLYLIFKKKTPAPAPAPAPQPQVVTVQGGLLTSLLPLFV